MELPCAKIARAEMAQVDEVKDIREGACAHRHTPERERYLESVRIARPIISERL